MSDLLNSYWSRLLKWVWRFPELAHLGLAAPRSPGQRYHTSCLASWPHERWVGRAAQPGAKQRKDAGPYRKSQQCCGYPPCRRPRLNANTPSNPWRPDAGSDNSRSPEEKAFPSCLLHRCPLDHCAGWQSAKVGKSTSWARNQHEAIRHNTSLTLFTRSLPHMIC